MLHIVRPLLDYPVGGVLDFKGQVRTGNGVYCHPLTIADQHTRFVLMCQENGAHERMHRTLKRRRSSRCSGPLLCSNAGSTRSGPSTTPSARTTR